MNCQQNKSFCEKNLAFKEIKEAIERDFSETELKNFLKNFIFILKRNFSQENLQIENDRIILQKDETNVEFIFSLINENYILKRKGFEFFIKSEEMNIFSFSDKIIEKLHFEKFFKEEEGKIKIFIFLEVNYIDEAFEEKIDLNVKNFEDLVLDYYLKLGFLKIF